MPQVIPLTSDSVIESTTVTLDGALYTITVYWSHREQCWYFDLLLADGTPLLSGKKLNPGFDLLHSMTDERFPPGVLTVIDQSNTEAPPERYDLGTRVLLIYRTAAEVGRG